MKTSDQIGRGNKPRHLKKPSFKKILASVLIRQSIFLIALVAGFTISSVFAVAPELEVEYAPENPTTSSLSDLGKEPEKAVTKLMIENDCWTSDDPPRAEIPSKVVFTYEDEVFPKVGGTAEVDLALKQIFEGEKHGMLVHGFCV